MGAGNNFPTVIAEQQYIGNVKEVCQSSNQTNLSRQMLKHN